MKKITSTIIATTMVVGSIVTSHAITNLTDLPATNHWAYNNIKYVYENDLMTGTSDTAFSPNRTMSRSEFITVMVRAMYPGANTDSNGGNWYAGYVRVAIDEGLITSTKYTEAQLSEGMPRQEMAWMMMNYVEANESNGYDLVNTWQIADYDSIGNQYQKDVRIAYSLGLLSGTDDKGTFKPQGTMTRQEAAAVINRMVDASIRSSVEVLKPEVEAGAITITEGEVSVRRNAKVGDTFIKADGTSIILTAGPNGIVGEGQGVAPDLGMKGFDYSTPLANGDKMASAGLGYTNSYGSTINNIQYKVNEYTGEGHWDNEWVKMGSFEAYPSYTTDVMFQISDCGNFAWAPTNTWTCLIGLSLTDSVMADIVGVNGVWQG